MISSLLSTPLDDLTLVFLDVETTGLAPRLGDRVCEIAVVRSRVDLVQMTFQALVNPERSISPGAAAVNGLSDRDLANAPHFVDIADTVLSILSDAAVVCHNAPFDLGFLVTELRRAGREFRVPVVVDTLALARRCFSFGSNSLPRVAHALGIATPTSHRALADALTTREVYVRFVEHLWRQGARTLGDLVDAQGGPVAADNAVEIILPPAIAEALQSGQRLFLKYVDVQGELSERWVTPQEVKGIGDSLSLVAFCHLRQELRQFRLDRIIEMRLGD